MTATGVLAHQWGWDEILYFAVPVILALLWIRWAERRARNRRESEEGDEDQAANMTGRSEP
jgi:hypothetical protein